jgi:hypothetical protein
MPLSHTVALGLLSTIQFIVNNLQTNTRGQESRIRRKHLSRSEAEYRLLSLTSSVLTPGRNNTDV